MVVGKTVTLSTTPALLYAVSGRRASVVLSRASGGGATVLVAGDSAASDWFTMPADGSPVTIVVERDEELWAKCDQFAPLLAFLVSGD